MMTLLERMAGKVPYHKRGTEYDPMFQLIRQNVGHIETLRERGFTWGAIGHELCLMAQEAGIDPKGHMPTKAAFDRAKAAMA